MFEKLNCCNIKDQHRISCGLWQVQLASSVAIPFEIKSILPDVIQLRARGFFKWCLFLIATRFFIAFFEFQKDNKWTSSLWSIYGFLWKSWLHIRLIKSRNFQRARAIGRQYFLGDQSKISFRRCSSNQIQLKFGQNLLKTLVFALLLKNS